MYPVVLVSALALVRHWVSSWIFENMHLQWNETFTPGNFKKDHLRGSSDFSQGELVLQIWQLRPKKVQRNVSVISPALVTFVLPLMPVESRMHVVCVRFKSLRHEHDVIKAQVLELSPATSLSLHFPIC